MGLFSKRKSSSSDLPGSNDSDFYCGTGDIQRQADMFWEKKMRLLLNEGLISYEEFEEALRTKSLHQDFGSL
jgi:hypothetical protein